MLIHSCMWAAQNSEVSLTCYVHHYAYSTKITFLHIFFRNSEINVFYYNLKNILKKFFLNEKAKKSKKKLNITIYPRNPN